MKRRTEHLTHGKLMKVARAWWERDGKPDRDKGDPITVGRADYEAWLHESVLALNAEGWDITRTTDKEPK